MEIKIREVVPSEADFYREYFMKKSLSLRVKMPYPHPLYIILHCKNIHTTAENRMIWFFLQK
jgi:hypothetical protein